VSRHSPTLVRPTNPIRWLASCVPTASVVSSVLPLGAVGVQATPDSPLQPHASSPAELAARRVAERHGAPFLVHRDGDDRQRIVELVGRRLTIGRRDDNDVSLGWDSSVSRVHAALERIGADWTLYDDGLSRHGTFVNGERLTGRRRLIDGDVIIVGETALAYVASSGASPSESTAMPPSGAAVALTPAQRRVLVALCRPFKDALYASPAGNRQIAAELVVSVDAVKARLKELFEAFEVGDLPQNEKRAALAIEALRRGVITSRDL
jgi:pSer/pThr/pTyr-binding forkhead associated (FHA) protein